MRSIISAWVKTAAGEPSEPPRDCRRLVGLSYPNDLTVDFSRPGKPTDNAFVEAFNSKLRAEFALVHEP